MSNWHYGIPKRENELRAAVSSPVVTTQLSPEELEEIRRKYPATKRDKAFKKPVEIKTRPKGDNDMAKPKFNLTEEQFNAERAAGKTVGQIAEEQGVSEATIYNHISKWTEARKPAQQKLLREKDVSPAADPKAELLDKAEKEIERLTTENQRLEERMTRSHVEATKAWAEVERLRDQNAERGRDEYKLMYEKSYKLNQDQTAKISEHLATINSLREHRDSLIAENSRLVERNADLLDAQLSQQTPASVVPDTEVQRLDSAIQDLTRARWILGRLSASGE
ncbi:hypothetical protein QP794_27110 [Paenibacillus sp. UMB7766-LJ446]|uniref:hypothetical protein n=1 Tax=Paenibacillus sp. UMB7766-LJ446 TaxID=3046313 RepID=UPI00254F2536|nr:hypothetical protein [Paenibacillus sp. UMB7766-LJ446]MDK8193758.1 hypothetical protein [Paenibacillus sp. UMB7766-LJ446]